MTGFTQVSTTTDTRANADKIAKKLLQERLTACVQILGPIHSSYWWNGKLEHAKEWLCVVKAQTNDYRRIELVIKKHHAYKVPEVVALPILRGNDDYLKWIRRETTRRK